MRVLAILAWLVAGVSSAGQVWLTGATVHVSQGWAPTANDQVTWTEIGSFVAPGSMDVTSSPDGPTPLHARISVTTKDIVFDSLSDPNLTFWCCFGADAAKNGFSGYRFAFTDLPGPINEVYRGSQLLLPGSRPAVVTFDESSITVNMWNSFARLVVQVPEPSTSVLFAIGLLACRRTRR